VLGRDISKVDLAIGHFLPDEVMLNFNVLYPPVELIILSQGNSALVVAVDDRGPAVVF